MIKNGSGHMEGIIFDIQRYSLHDGEGIRTLVFMKGCPLRCLWCSNPESQRLDIETGLIEGNCIRCGRCYESCPRNAISPYDFKINRTLCDNCLECARVCPVKSKMIIGRKITVDELMETVEKDRIFFQNSSGGITVGGGEPSVQSEFVREFLKKCKEHNLNTSIETCGHAPWEKIHDIVEYADVVHFDIKHMNNELHKKYTGVGNATILENLAKIGGLKDVIIRIPAIPGLNDDNENLNNTIRFASKIKKAIRVELLPFHTLGYGKYNWIGKKNHLTDLKPYSEEQRSDLAERVGRILPDTDISVKII